MSNKAASGTAGMRAHMNCLENLPIYTAIVVALLAARGTSPILDG